MNGITFLVFFLADTGHMCGAVPQPTHCVTARLPFDLVKGPTLPRPEAAPSRRGLAVCRSAPPPAASPWISVRVGEGRAGAGPLYSALWYGWHPTGAEPPVWHFWRRCWSCASPPAHIGVMWQHPGFS